MGGNLQAFSKFKQGVVKSHSAKFSDLVQMNHIEARILESVAQLYPEIFAELDRYCSQNRSYLEERIAVFDREVQFYISYHEYIRKFKRAGLQFTYPVIASDDKEVYEHDGFDLALANKLLSEKHRSFATTFFCGMRSEQSSSLVRIRGEDDFRPHVRPATLSGKHGLSGSWDESEALALRPALHAL